MEVIDMLRYTTYKGVETDQEIKAVLWDGDYSLYRDLVKFESDFVGVLDDGGQKGRDAVKIWNDFSSSWETCERGSYIVKYPTESFGVIDRENLITRFRTDV